MVSLTTNPDFDNNIYMTRAGVVIPTVSGSISAISSFVILSFIVRSRNNTIYHRIMFLLSFADIITSVAIALTTLPMPKDVIYPFAGPSYGNVQSCEAQGFLYLSGSSLTFSMNGILNLYYLCTLVFNISEVTFRRCIEPLLYLACFTGCLVAPAVLLLQEDILNPTTVDPFCAAAVYPLGCNKQDNPNCRGASGEDNITLCSVVALSTSLFILMVTMGSIFYTFTKREKNVRKNLHRSLREKPQDFHEIENEWEEAQSNKRRISKQILMYVGAFVITWIIPCVIVFFGAQKNLWLQVTRMILQPLQGFFNMLIFFYHKLDVIRKSGVERTVWEALCMLFGAPRESPELVAVSNLELIHRNNFVNVHSRRISSNWIRNSLEGHSSSNGALLPRQSEAKFPLTLSADPESAQEKSCPISEYNDVDDHFVTRAVYSNNIVEARLLRESEIRSHQYGQSNLSQSLRGWT